MEADTSLFASGAVLLQEDSNGEEHPLGFLSTSFNTTERNYQVRSQIVRDYMSTMRMETLHARIILLN